MLNRVLVTGAAGGAGKAMRPYLDQRRHRDHEYSGLGETSGVSFFLLGMENR
ncbi:uronate dehydrogenase [Chromohalobacter canadensis]|uniref:Uronate dehydrogenase n=1 Tax=Chromohalobacter canadensis TaxID=141389 RepID=A0A285VUW8_9GAMM|nr:uronate dehydrogenase [Chromohalobacter canadensis]